MRAADIREGIPASDGGRAGAGTLSGVDRTTIKMKPLTQRMGYYSPLWAPAPSASNRHEGLADS